MVLFKLLGLPFSLPAAGVKFVFNQLIETAEQEMMDDGPVKEALLELQMRLEEGEIEEAEFAEQELVLFQRLREIRAYREQKFREMIARAQEEQDEEAGDLRGPISYQAGSVVIETDLDDDEER
jgi:hypothetical protein